MHAKRVFISLTFYVASNILCAYYHLSHCGLGKHICFHALDKFYTCSYMINNKSLKYCLAAMDSLSQA